MTRYLFGGLRGSGLLVGSVFGHSDEPFDLLFSGECLRDLTYDGEFFRFTDLHDHQIGRARWVMGIPAIDHPRALHLPLLFPYIASGRSAIPKTTRKQFGITAVISNLGSGGLARRRAALVHELSHFLPVHANRALRKMAPPGSQVIYHDVDDKSRFLGSFTHHLCFENHAFPGYLTEKIADALLAGAVPLYSGDPRVCEWVEDDSFIDCSNLDAESIAKIVTRRPELIRRVDSERERLFKVSPETMTGQVLEFQGRVLRSADTSSSIPAHRRSLSND
jgi:hypothetical protein